MKAKKNSGFSLVELIVVIAIMAVAAGAFGYTMHLVTSARAKQTAEKIKTTIENTRQQAMAHGSAYAEIYVNKDANGEIWVRQYINGTLSSDEKAGSSKITIAYHPLDSTDTDMITLENKDGGVASLKLYYEGGSGSFKDLICDTITITGLGKDYTITCYSLTGRITME